MMSAHVHTVVLTGMKPDMVAFTMYAVNAKRKMNIKF